MSSYRARQIRIAWSCRRSVIAPPLRKDVCLVASLLAQRRAARVRINTGSCDTSVEKRDLIERVSNGEYRSVPERSDGKYICASHIVINKCAIIAFPANFTSRESMTLIDTKKVPNCACIVCHKVSSMYNITNGRARQRRATFLTFTFTQSRDTIFASLIVGSFERSHENATRLPVFSHFLRDESDSLCEF